MFSWFVSLSLPADLALVFALNFLFQGFLHFNFGASHPALVATKPPDLQRLPVFPSGPCAQATILPPDAPKPSDVEVALNALRWAARRGGLLERAPGLPAGRREPFELFFFGAFCFFLGRAWMFFFLSFGFGDVRVFLGDPSLQWRPVLVIH